MLFLDCHLKFLLYYHSGEQKEIPTFLSGSRPHSRFHVCMLKNPLSLPGPIYPFKIGQNLSYTRHKLWELRQDMSSSTSPGPYL